MFTVGPCLADLCRHVRAVRADTPAHDVHQLRTNAARLTVWVRLAGRRVLAGDLRWLRRSCARLRDLDVALERPAPAAWRRWLAREREREAAHVRGVLASERVDGLLAALAVARPPEPKRARRELVRLGRRLARALRELDARAATLDDLHDVRRHARRLRYAREWHGRTAHALVRMQRDLAPLGDAAAELRLLGDAQGVAGLAEHRASVTAAAELHRGSVTAALTRTEPRS